MVIRHVSLEAISRLAQWLACWAHNPKVPGSKPGSATSFRRFGVRVSAQNLNPTEKARMLRAFPSGKNMGENPKNRDSKPPFTLNPNQPQTLKHNQLQKFLHQQSGAVVSVLGS